MTSPIVVKKLTLPFVYEEVVHAVTRYILNILTAMNNHDHSERRLESLPEVLVGLHIGPVQVGVPIQEARLVSTGALGIYLIASGHAIADLYATASKDDHYDDDDREYVACLIQFDENGWRMCPKVAFAHTKEELNDPSNDLEKRLLS
jgi:hypothetical protein